MEKAEYAPGSIILFRHCESVVSARDFFEILDNALVRRFMQNSRYRTHDAEENYCVACSDSPLGSFYSDIGLSLLGLRIKADEDMTA